METFTRPRPFARHEAFAHEREAALRQLKHARGDIDPPILSLIRSFAQVRHCYTLQSCYGHFVHAMQPDIHNTEPFAPYAGKVAEVRYRIAYLALVIERSEPGMQLYDDLSGITRLDPKYIQFGSADWFWRIHPNSYILQLEPERCMDRDSVVIPADEALYIERLRFRFFGEISRIAEKHQEPVD